jgi:hypothetical protein
LIFGGLGLIKKKGGCTMQKWKLDRITTITDEVNDFHPLLKQVFSADRSITRFEYTHGNTEMGADFVLARPDPTLGEEHYVGVIVKCGGIKQNFEDVRRQIEECKVERYFEGGKKKIYLTEIWIVTNGAISNGAERKIFEDFKTRNVRFIDGDKVAQLVDKHASHFWNHVPEVLAAYLNVTHAELLASEAQMSLLPSVSVGHYIDQDLRALESPTNIKVKRIKAPRRLKLVDAILSNKVMLVEAGMGAGKSSLFRRTSIAFCTVDLFAEYKIVPKIIHFKDIFGNPVLKVQKIFDEMDLASVAFKEPVTQLLFIDAIDELDCGDDARLSVVQEITALVKDKENVRVVFGSRAIWTVDEEIELDKLLNRFSVCPLTPTQMVQFLGEVCKTLSLTARFKEELTRSNIFRVLPKTPMSTVLLAKIMNAGLKELPQTLPELYSKYTELALGRWDASKGLSAEREYPLLANLVEQLAEYMMDNNLDAVSLSEVRERFHSYLQAREDVPSAEEVLEKLSQRTELIAISREENIFRFRHKTFLEYFYAAQLKEKMGKAAPIKNPFDGYWLGVEYFYLGLIQDAGERIDSLSRLVIESERQLFLKLLNFGNLLLAAHRTEYSYVERGLYQLVLEVGSHFLAVQAGKKTSALGNIAKLQFLGILSLNMRYVLGFDYFKKALETVSLELEYDAGIGEDHRIVCSFLVDGVRASLGVSDAFKFLLEKSSGDLDWVIRLGIHHVAQDEGIKTDALQRFEKRLVKMRKGNKGVDSFIKDLYETSMIDLRKKLIN